MLHTNWLQRLGHQTIDLLFPATCLACNAQLEEDNDRIAYCFDCRAMMQRGDWPVCQRCASRVPRFPGEIMECGHCRDQKLWFDRTISFGDYDDLLRDQCLAMKTDRSERIAHALGRLIARHLKAQLEGCGPDAIVPQPMHFWRRVQRGTNPPAALGAAIGAELGLPVYPDLLSRLRNTQPQVGLSNPARFRNVRNELQVNASYHFEAPHVLLVDDILTTGATCSEAARVLKRAGAAKVTVLVAARTASY